MGRVYRVAQAGLGAQGLAHLEGQTGNPGSFSLEAVCDLYGERLDKVCAERPGVGRYSEAERMLDEVRPDVFTFVTQPDVRLEMVRLAVRYGVKVLVFEKPMALSLADAAETVRTLREAGIKSVVCHQHKYQHTFRKMKEIVDSGAIGKVTQINFSTQAWMAQ
ncbi:MAG: Gfo/Idh/MocA family oxidoreductase, partial [Oscillospiraceae bacterium]|nr:Gfo/Idh/MocA family oxidoreductase [Oscillospiraceae bacterium]